MKIALTKKKLCGKNWHRVFFKSAPFFFGKSHNKNQNCSDNTVLSQYLSLVNACPFIREVFVISPPFRHLRECWNWRKFSINKGEIKFLLIDVMLKSVPRECPSPRWVRNTNPWYCSFYSLSVLNTTGEASESHNWVRLFGRLRICFAGNFKPTAVPSALWWCRVDIFIKAWINLKILKQAKEAGYII